MTAKRVYTLAEATALLGRLDALLAGLRGARAVLTDRALAATMAQRGPRNGGGAEGRRFAESALAFSRGMAQLDEWGVIVRDLESGICDFPARRDGRTVYLCWRVGEDRIAFWHELEDGFAGRQPLDERTV